MSLRGVPPRQSNLLLLINEGVASPPLRLRALPSAQRERLATTFRQLECPGQHHAEDGYDHAQVQEQVASGDYIIKAKDEWQNVIDDHQQNAQQRQ